MRKPMPVRAFAAALLGGFLVAACQTPEEALLDSGQSQVQLRSIQTRSFDTTDKEKTLRTVIATMQDLNFVIDKADLTLGTVTATKLDRYMLRMTVSVRPRGQTQLLVRANANFGLKPVTEPEPYQKFFASLGKAMFLTAHEEGAGDGQEQAVEKVAPAAGADQQAGLVAPPAAAPEPPIPLAIAQPSVAATSPSSGIAPPTEPINFDWDRPEIIKAIREYYDGPGQSYDHPTSSQGGTMGTLKTLTKLGSAGDQIEVEAEYTWAHNTDSINDSDHTGKFVLKKEGDTYQVVKMWSKNFGWK